MRKIGLFFLLLVTLSCNKNTSDESLKREIEDAKKANIMLHDVVMADMGEVRNLKDSLIKLENDVDSLKTIELNLRVSDLEKADKAMWDWMHNFDINFKAESDSATLEYFQKKHTEIKQVKKLFESSLANGRSYLSGSTDDHVQ